LAERIPITQLLRLKHPEAEDQTDGNVENLKWSAYYICDAWAEKRGFMTAKAGRNDVYRAANHILRTAAQGKLCLCMRPPGYFKQKDKWENHVDTQEIALLQEQHRVSLQNIENDEEQSDEQSDEDNEDDEDELACGTTLVNKFALLSDE